MSTRFTKSKADSQSISMGYEGSEVPEDFSIPSCTIEDVDRALFDLFNDEIPFYYKLEEESRKIPVIFATGERFAILRRKRPLRSKSGALILPLISILRSGIEQTQTKGGGPGQTQPLTIKKRLHKTDPLYQRLINKPGLINQDNLAADEHFTEGLKKRGIKPGMVASRRDPMRSSIKMRSGMLLVEELSNKNVYEFITIPPIKYFTTTYEISFWTQYTQQMNHMITALMSAYQDMHQRTFRLETAEGYWFVAYVQPGLSSDNNFSDFSDQERLVRYSFSVEVPAYIVNPSYPGAPNALRSFSSATDISFDIIQPKGKMIAVTAAGPPSGDPAKYILEDLRSEDADLPGTALLGKDGKASSDSTNITEGTDALEGDGVDIGGATTGADFVMAPELGVNPFTGETYEVPIPPIISTAKGESTYKDLGDGKINPGFEVLEEIDL